MPTKCSASTRPIFDPYLNYHRPCGFATLELSDNGKRRRRYRLTDYRTPYEKLLLLRDWGSCLKPGISAARLEQQALPMQQRKRKLLVACRSRRSSWSAAWNSAALSGA